LNGFLILKQLGNSSDDRVVETGAQNVYSRLFCSQHRFVWKLPCDPSELSYFLRRIGEDEDRKTFDFSIVLHSNKVKETKVVVNFTVQKKNITLPVGANILNKNTARDHAQAKLEDGKLQLSRLNEIRSFLRYLRFKSKDCRQDKSQRAVKRLCASAGILASKLERKLFLGALSTHQQALDLYKQVHQTQFSDIGKIYSLHAPRVFIISKGYTTSSATATLRANTSFYKTTLKGVSAIMQTCSFQAKCLNFKIFPKFRFTN